MSDIDDGGPAFPYSALTPEGPQIYADSHGMSLRDYFAIHAPEPTQDQVAFLAGVDRAANPHGDNYKPERRSVGHIIADLRYAYADAMIARRKLAK